MEDGMNAGTVWEGEFVSHESHFFQDGKWAVVFGSQLGEWATMKGGLAIGVQFKSTQLPN